MLIIKPIEMDKVEISDYFIDWNPGVLRLVIKNIMSCFYTNVINACISIYIAS